MWLNKKIVNFSLATIGLVALGFHPVISSTSSHATEVSGISNKHYALTHDFFVDLASTKSDCTSADSGYAGVQTDAEALTFTLFWVGEIPNDVSLALQSLPGDVSVTVVPAKYSWCQMQSSISAIVDSDYAGNFAVLSPRVDGSGVDLSPLKPMSVAQRLELENTVQDLADVTAEVVMEKEAGPVTQA